MLRGSHKLRYIGAVALLLVSWSVARWARSFPLRKHGEKAGQVSTLAEAPAGSVETIRGNAEADRTKPGGLTGFATELFSLTPGQRRPLWEIQATRLRGLGAEGVAEIDAFLSEKMDVDLGPGDSLESSAFASTLRIGLIILLGEMHGIETVDLNLRILQATGSVIEAMVAIRNLEIHGPYLHAAAEIAALKRLGVEWLSAPRLAKATETSLLIEALGYFQTEELLPVAEKLVLSDMAFCGRYANALNAFPEQVRSEASIRFLRGTRGGLDKTLLNTERAKAMTGIEDFLLRGDFRSKAVRAEVIASFREWPEASVWWGLLYRLNSFYYEPLPAKLFVTLPTDESDEPLLRKQFGARLEFLDELAAAVHAPDWPNDRFWDESIEQGRANLSRKINRLPQARH